MRRLPLIALMLCLLAGCGDDARIATVLNRTDSLMNSRPDSALVLLDSALRTGDASDRQTARLRLRRLNAINKLDTVFTEAHVAQASELAAHFDRHGTPNERMLAHYLLGRTYADAGQAPQAIQSYLEAAECADTTSVDCDYRQLCFVYSQMGVLLFYQCLYQDMLEAIDKAVKYGYLAGDTLHALSAYILKADAYHRMQMSDSSRYVCEMASLLYARSGFPQESAAVLADLVIGYIDEGKIQKAHQSLYRYEHESGYFDTSMNIEKGREFYYYIKGYYYEAARQMDSAEYYYRKELQQGKDFYNQNSGSKGLSRVFLKSHRPDSAAKYALYSYAMNDSVYAQMATRDVNHMKAIYDYSHFQRVAEKEKEQAEKERSKRNTIILSFLFLCAISGYKLFRLRQKHKVEYDNQIKRLGKAYEDLLLLKSQKDLLIRTLEENNKKNELQKTLLEEMQAESQSQEILRSEVERLIVNIEMREQEIEELKKSVAKYQQKERLTQETADSRINNSAIYKRFKQKCVQGKQLSDEEWQQIIQLVIRELPGFYNLISSRERSLSSMEYFVCILERLDVEPRRMHYLIGISESYVSKIRSGLHRKIFGFEGSKQQFSQEIKHVF